MNNTRCLTCGTISKGETCNECGGFNVPVPHYHENGTVFCKKCRTWKISNICKWDLEEKGMVCNGCVKKEDKAAKAAVIKKK